MNNTQSHSTVISTIQLNTSLERSQRCYMQCEVTAKGFVELHLKAMSNSHWQQKNHESAMVRMYVNQQYNQDLILFYGKESFVYTRLIGQLEAGTYEIELEFREQESPSKVNLVYLEQCEFHWISPASSSALVYQHTPILYGRNLTHNYESTFTDTPLLLMYWMQQKESRTIIEYHMVFSHEDEGTPSGLLMSKWGRTTDIEWMYRVELDLAGHLLTATYQGPNHVTTAFQGNTDCGGLPILQAATANGNFVDEVRSDYRLILPPSYRWYPEQEPREQIMSDYPFTYQVTNWEMNRQYIVERNHDASSWKLGDQRQYLFIQSSKFALDVYNSRADVQQTCLDYQVRLQGQDEWFSSSFGDLRVADFRAAYQGPDLHFSTTIKLRSGIYVDQIAEIRVTLLPEGVNRIGVKGIYAFMLDHEYVPTKGIQASTQVELTSDAPTQTLWSCMTLI